MIEHLSPLWEIGIKQAGVEEKLKILSFWTKRGLEATIETYGVKRRAVQFQKTSWGT